MGIFCLRLPTITPVGTEADRVILYMTLDELNPTTFYPVKSVALNIDPTTIGDTVLQPTAAAITSGVTFGFTQTDNATDESLDSVSTSGRPDAAPGGKNTISTDWTAFPSGTVDSWILQVRYSINFGGDDIILLEKAGVDRDGVFTIKIEFSTNSFSTDTDLLNQTYTVLTDGDTAQTTLTATILAINPNVVGVRASITRVSGTEFLGPLVNIHDIRLLLQASGDGSIIVAGFPLGTESPIVNAANIGQFQPPPKRMFHNIIFEGHALARSDTNGLFLAYSRTDEPEHWSTNSKKSAFPYLIPFKEREADDLVGADKVANQLIVFATDSVWRINHLPVLSDPSGSLAELFLEARSTVKRRITDTVGCVGVRAYSRMQISSEEDFVFFWSLLGPMMTDGFRVWRAADHVDWSWLHPDQTKCIVTNFTSNQRLEVELRDCIPYSSWVNIQSYRFNRIEGSWIKLIEGHI